MFQLKKHLYTHSPVNIGEYLPFILFIASVIEILIVWK